MRIMYHLATTPCESEIDDDHDDDYGTSTAEFLFVKGKSFNHATIGKTASISSRTKITFFVLLLIHPTGFDGSPRKKGLFSPLTKPL